MQNSVAERILRLEKTNRRFKTLSLVLLAVSALVIAAAPKGPKKHEETITVTKLILIDKEDRARAVLGIDENDNARLVFNDKEGKPRVELGLDAYGNPQLEYSADGRQVLELYGAPLDGTPYLRFNRATESGQEASLQLSNRALEIMALGDRTGIELSVDARGKPKVVVNEPVVNGKSNR